MTQKRKTAKGPRINHARVRAIIEFIEKLIIPSGHGAGGMFRLNRSEKRFIRAVYGPTRPEGYRLVRRAILSMGRKNGKSVITACLALVHLVGPEAMMNGEIYSAATEKEQAALVFKYACQIVRSDEELRQMVKIVETTKTMISLVEGSRGSTYKAISAEAGSKFGYNPTVVIYDELAQAKNRELYDALDTSMAAREEPLFIVISTQSKDPQHILSELIDDGLSEKDPTTVCHLYAVPDDADDEAIFTDRKLWKQANPALGTFRSLDEIRVAAARAERMPSFEAPFRNLYLNQRVDATSPFIPRAEWVSCRAENREGDQPLIAPGEEIYLGLDLSGKIDLSSLVAVSASRTEDRLMAWFWKPAANVDEHEKRDRVPYRLWVDQGFIETTPGRAIEYDWVAARLGEIAATYTIIGLAFDRWRIDDMLAAMRRVGVDGYIEGKDTELSGGIRMVSWGQGYASMTQAVEAIEISVLERRLQHDGNPVLTWNFSNAVVMTDPAGNRKLDKSATRFRIDGTVAATMAVGLKSRDLKEEEGPSVYETRGVFTFG